jgi:TP901 family phage tail tape measure protein
MAERSVLVRLMANVTDFKAGLQQAERAAKGFGNETEKQSRQANTAFGRMAESAQRNERAWNTAGTALTAFGAVATVAIGASVKAAIDWESAWAGVTKTVDGSEQELAALETGLRGLARTLPSTHGEIAAVAEAAGQLGVKTADVVSFTRTMVDLGETTNLSADEAATSIAQMMNVMQTAPEDVGRLGSALVALGNAGASTERDIIQMSQRISGAAAVVGMSEADVLAFSNAVASMGINVEAGGTSVARVLTDMSKAAQTGGADLEVFARTAGVSAAEFSRAFLEDPAEAFASFISGLGGIQEAGGNVFAVLTDLGLSDVRVSQALLGMASSGDLLRDSLDLGATAWEENNALVEEAAKRYDTTAAKLAMARNNIVDAGIEIGEVFLPMVASAAEGVADLASGFADLPDPIQATVGGLVGVAGVAGLAGGGFLLLFPRVIETYKAFQTLKTASPGVASGLGAVGKAAGIAGVIWAAASALDGLVNSMRPAAPTMEETTSALLGMGESMQDIDAQFRSLSSWSLIAGEIDGLEGAIQRLVHPSVRDSMGDFTAKVLTLGSREGNDERERLVGQFNQIGESLALMVGSGNAELAAKQFELLAAQWEAAGGDVEDLMELLPTYDEALQGIDNEQKLAAQSAQGLGDAAAGAVPQIDEAAEAVAKWREELAGLSASFVDPLAAYQGMIQEAAQATADSTEDATDSWSDFVADTTVSLGELATRLEEQITAQENWRTNLGLIAGWAGEEVAQHLAAMGTEGVQLVAQMADGTDAEAQRMAALILEDIRLGGAQWATALDEEMAVMGVIARVGTKATVHGIASELQIGVNTVRDIVGRYGLEVAEGVDPLLEALGKPGTVSRMVGVQALARRRGLADGGVVDFYGDGGMRENHVAQFAKPGDWRVWAEPETGGEAYIPLHPGKHTRSVDIWRQVGDRLGVQFQEFRFGGINDVPKPYSTAPYGPPISTAGDAAMQKAYGETVDWLKKNLAPALGPGIGWQAQMAALRTQFPGLALNSGFRPGSITATGNLSYHALGRAVDVPARMDVFDWILAHYGSQSPELIFSPAGARQRLNGLSHLYSEPTRGDHWDHIHWAMRLGGIVDFFKPGGLFNPHVRDAGGPLLPGYTFNGTGGLEDVVPRHVTDAGTSAPVVVVAPAGGERALVGQVNQHFPPGTSPRAAMTELVHELKVIQRGGVFSGSRE